MFWLSKLNFLNVFVVCKCLNGCIFFELLKKIMINFDINLKWEKNDKKSKIRYIMVIY